MKNVSNLICWSVVVLLLLVGGANASASLFQQTNDEKTGASQAASKEAATEKDGLKTEFKRSPYLSYASLNRNVPEGSDLTRRAKDLLFEGKYDESIEELKSLFPTNIALTYELEHPDDYLGVFPKYYEIFQTMAVAYELKGDWHTAGKIYSLIHRDNRDEAIKWLEVRRQYATDKSLSHVFGTVIGLLSRDYGSLDVDKTLRRAEESKDKPEQWFIIPIDKDVYDDEDIRVYALKDRLAHTACPKLHVTYPTPWIGNVRVENASFKQAELSHESYLKFLESMEEEYEKYKAQDPSTVRPELRDAETVEKVMTMLRKIGELPY